MKILFLSQGLPFPVYQDGLTVRVYHLLKELSRHAEIHLIAFGDHELTADEAAELRSMASYDIVDYLSPKGITGFAKKVVSNRRYYDERFVRRIQDAIESFKPDVALCEQTFMAQYAGVLDGIPKIMSAVDAISLAAFSQAGHEEGIIRKLMLTTLGYQRANFEKKNYPDFQWITAVSGNDADYLSKLIGIPVDVVPNGVDVEYFSPQRNGLTRDTIVFTGVLSNPGNEEACAYLLRDVFPKVHVARPDIRFVIAGRHPPRGLVSEVPPYVNLLANISDIRDAFSRSVIYVSPIKIGAGIKNNVLQALSLGVPVLTNSFIADPINIVDGENCFIQNDRTEFANTILQLLSNQPLLDQIGNNGRAHVVNTLSWYSAAFIYLKKMEYLIDSDKLG